MERTKRLVFGTIHILFLLSVPLDVYNEVSTLPLLMMMKCWKKVIILFPHQDDLVSVHPTESFEVPQYYASEKRKWTSNQAHWEQAARAGWLDFHARHWVKASLLMKLHALILQRQITGTYRLLFRLANVTNNSLPHATFILTTNHPPFSSVQPSIFN
ncbi:hypothetical protein CRM22_001794 [Opisthorchis felineus]|uniref:Uncharacterized protein n=1 Tax=Opisthorchis felineus TaxID=147828 RepID=A0A4S2M963_OPIFE|nr:hypothetical protein CRM22_001794 [Opisthorchis felineus]